MLARGGPRAAMLLDDSDATMSLDFSFLWLDVKTTTSGAVLDRVGPAVLDETIALLVALNRRFGARAGLIKARAVPFATGSFRYPRARPPREARRDLDAIVD